MTEAEIDEIAALATEVKRLHVIYDMRATMNTPTDPAKAEEAYALMKVAETKWMEALGALHRAQCRIQGDMR